MCCQKVLNTISVIFFIIIFGIFIYLPSERSHYCNDNECKLIFLWAEACLLILSLMWIVYCLYWNMKAEKSEQPKVLINSKTLFETIILSFFLLCVISNITVLVGISIDDNKEFPMLHLTPRLVLRILRAVIAALLTLWIIVYDMKYPEGNFAINLKLRKCLHAFVSGVIFVQPLRFAAFIILWPSAMKNILEKTNQDALYFSITIPASNMFWLRCFFKCWQGHSNGTSNNVHTEEPSESTGIIEGSRNSTVVHGSNIKLGCAVVIALMIVGIMYGIDLLDTSKVNTKCMYGLFRTITPPVIGLFIIVFCIWHKRTKPMAAIKLHDWERYVFLGFFIMKIGINVLNCIWFSSLDHPDGDCKVPGISIAAQITDSLFNTVQFICLFCSCGRERLQRSFISYFLLVAMNCGLIWFDLSIEVLHLRHYTHDYDHLNSAYIFLTIQAAFWIGIEFHVTIVELLIMGCLKPHG